ncbi:hypothetical protein JTB14_037593 [Gonioctena quinquepunctata]|nr:hypothetical protein JTB14_037593 [Gonioctena quinquepunctata]
MSINLQTVIMMLSLSMDLHSIKYLSRDIRVSFFEKQSGCVVLLIISIHLIAHSFSFYSTMLYIIIWATALAILFYHFCVKPMYQWRERGIKQTDPVWLLGDNWGLFLKKESFFEMMLRCYNKFPGDRYSGMYQFVLPTLVIRDPELVKQIAVKDFEYFTDHRAFIPEKADPFWAKNLFALKGKKWREMRPILSPSFTSSKMRAMFALMSECSEHFTKHFLQKGQNCIELDMKDTFTRYTCNVIATTAFGIKVDSLGEPTNEFYIMGKEVTNFSGIIMNLKLLGYTLCPKIFEILKIKLFSKRVNQFFRNLVDDTIRTREENNIIRPDMIHLLMEARKGVQQKEENVGVDAGFATVEEADLGKGGDVTKITNLDITAQALIFFFAGFDAVSSLMCFLSHELAVNPDIQTRLRREIEDTLAECKGKITYEALLKMKYMDMVVSECLRKWPFAVGADRLCVKPYTIQPANTR